MLKRCTYLMALLVSSVYAFAQENSNTANTDIMRSNGKIYVVMAVVLTILTGLFIYLFSVDKKLKNLEK